MFALMLLDTIHSMYNLGSEDSSIIADQKKKKKLESVGHSMLLSMDTELMEKKKLPLVNHKAIFYQDIPILKLP